MNRKERRARAALARKRMDTNAKRVLQRGFTFDYTNAVLTDKAPPAVPALTSFTPFPIEPPTEEAVHAAETIPAPPPSLCEVG